MTFSLVLAFLKSDLALRLVIAALCGALIGAEREFIGKPAGVRTCALVCIGSALFSMIGLLTVNPVYGLSAVADVTDITRIASNVVQGIGFIGGGVIIFWRDKLVGLTTAAVIWLAAAVGMALGFGFIDVALFVTLLTLAILVFVGFVEKQIFKTKKRSNKKRRRTTL